MTRHKSVYATSVFAALALTALPAAADPGDDFLVRLAQRSPLDVSATAGVDEAYDSNVYNGRGPDFVTRVSPRLAIALHNRLAEAKLSYDLGLWTYAAGKAQSSVNHHAQAQLEVSPVRRLTLQLADEFVRAQDPGFLVRIGVVAPQTGITDNYLDAAAVYRITRTVDGTIGYTYRLTRFDQVPGVVLHDGDEHDVNAAGSVRVTRTDDVRLGYRFQYLLADRAGLAVTNSPVAGWRHAFLRDLELRVEAGPLRFDGVVPGEPSAWTWRGAGVLRFYTPAWRAALSYTHDLVSGTGAASVLWADYGYAQAGYHFREAFDLHGGVGLFQNGLAPSGARLYDGVIVDAVADWRLFSNVRLAAYYSFRYQETVAPAGVEAPIEPVTRHIVGLRLFAVIGAEARPPRREVHP